MNDEMRQRIALDFGFADLPPLEQERMIEKVGNLLFESVLEHSFDYLSEQDLSDYEKMLEKSGAGYETIMTFFKDRIKDFGIIVSEELGRLKKTSSALMT